MARVDINILNTNERHVLPRCIDAVKAQTYRDVRITVIDNASHDGSPEWLQAHHPDVLLIQNDRNLYYCGGHNVGIRASSAEYILLLNSDVFIQPEFLQEMVAAMDGNPRLGGVQGKLWKIAEPGADIPPEGKRWIDTTGILMTRSRRNFDRFQETIDDGSYDIPGEVFGPDGSAPLYRRAMLEDIRVGDEYFDEDFLIYRDVVDLSWRARSRGWVFWYVPSATGFHVRGFSPRKRKKQPLFFRKLSYRNRYLTLLKNETVESLIPHFVRFASFECAMLFHVLFREPLLASAWIDLVKLVPGALRKRRHIQRRRTVSNREITRGFAVRAPRLHTLRNDNGSAPHA